MKVQRRNSKRVKRGSWAGGAPFSVDKQKAGGFILDIQEMVADEIQVESYVDLQLGSGDRGKKKVEFKVAADVS